MGTVSQGEFVRCLEGSFGWGCKDHHGGGDPYLRAGDADMEVLRMLREFCRCRDLARAGGFHGYVVELVLLVVVRPLMVVMQERHAMLQQQKQGQREHEDLVDFGFRQPSHKNPVKRLQKPGRYAFARQKKARYDAPIVAGFLGPGKVSKVPKCYRIDFSSKFNSADSSR